MSNKETIEEAAERIYREYPNNQSDKPEWDYNRDVNCFRKRKAFIKGAQWQAESMYELMDVYADDVMGGCNLRAEEWFNKLKKNKTMSNRKQTSVEWLIKEISRDRVGQ